jgi:ABC-type multidrug transport system ATPase subunit
MSALPKITPIALKVEDLWVVKGGSLFSKPNSLLQGISFSVKPGDFVGIIGPNGAGKTTLFRALVGEKPTQGHVLLYKNDGSQKDFEEFYDNPEYWMSQIGYVPVDNILHGELTVRQALLHIGQLRLPGKSDAEILAKIQQVIRGLGFDPNDSRLDQVTSTLSSGERKRMNIAAELLTDPPLLLLDEPTSNLDPNAERDLMDSLKRISGSNNNGNGPTILLITHTLSTIDRCDQVVFIENSKLAVEGSEEKVLSFLESGLLAECGSQAATSTENRFGRWAAVFDCYRTREERSQRLETKPDTPKPYTRSPNRTLPKDSFWRQFRILSNRYFLLRLNDFNGIFAILVSGFIAGFLMLIAPENVFLEARDATAARQTVVLYIILVVIMSAFNSHREVSKEFHIYIHERTKGVKPLAYLISKAAWLSIVIGIFATSILLALTGMPLARILVIVIFAAMISVGIWSALLSQVSRNLSRTQRVFRLLRMMVIALPLFLAFVVQLQNKQLPDYPINPNIVDVLMTLTVFMTAVASVALGILVSSVVAGNNDRATQLVIVVIIFNVILAFSVLNVIAPEFRLLFDRLEPFSAAYWGYSGVSSSLSIYCWAGQPRFENYNSIGNISSVWIYLLIHIIGTLALAVFVLRLQETWTTRQRQFGQMLRAEPVNYLTITVIVAMISWGWFLSAQSYSYYDLTFFDRLFGGNRYANIETYTEANSSQQVVGVLSRSFCAAPEPRQLSDQESMSTSENIDRTLFGGAV